jgi:hypothetical protein
VYGFDNETRDDDENNLGQILGVLTPAQCYLMFFNNRGLTTSSLAASPAALQPHPFDNRL